MYQARVLRKRLESQKLSFMWLRFQLKSRGLITDKTEMSKAFSGSRKGPKIEKILNLSKEILDEYDKSTLFVKGGSDE